MCPSYVFCVVVYIVVSGVTNQPLSIPELNYTVACTGDQLSFTCKPNEILTIVDAYHGYVAFTSLPNKCRIVPHCVMRVSPRYWTYLRDQCKNCSASSAIIECEGEAVESNLVVVYYTCNSLERIKARFNSRSDEKTITLTCKERPGSSISLVETHSVAKRWFLTVTAVEKDFLCITHSTERISELAPNEWLEIRRKCEGRISCNITLVPLLLDHDILPSCFSRMLEIAHICNTSINTAAVKTDNGNYVEGNFCPYGDLIHVTSTKLGANVSASRGYRDDLFVDDCTAHAEVQYHDLIVRKCEGGQSCDNLKALPYEFDCNGLRQLSEYVIIEYECISTEFNKTCLLASEDEDDIEMELSCDDMSHIWLDKEFTGLSWPNDAITTNNYSCVWNSSLDYNVADEWPQLYNIWANDCNLRSMCTIDQSLLYDKWNETGHLTVSYTCKNGTGVVLCPDSYPSSLTCTGDSQHREILGVRMGSGESQAISYQCMVDAPENYIRQTRDQCQHKEYCTNLLPPNELIFCSGRELYTNITQLTYICKNTTEPQSNRDCLSVNGTIVKLNCSNEQSILLKDNGTVYQRSLDVTTTNDTCAALGANDTCDVPVAEHSPGLFMAWKTKCDGKESCTLEVSPVSLVSTQCHEYCNSTECNATHVTHHFQCLETSFSYAFANEHFGGQLCFDTTVIDITEARYGLINLDCPLPNCVPDLEKDCLQLVQSDYLLDMMDSCNGKHHCSNLKALPSSIYCDNRRTYSDYVVIYYRCVDGNTTEPYPDPTTEVVNTTETESDSTTDYTDSTTETTQGTTTTPTTTGLSSPASHSIVAVISAIIGALLVVLIVLLIAKTRKKSDDTPTGKQDQSDLSPVEELRYETSPGQYDFYESVDARSAKLEGTANIPGSTDSKPKKPKRPQNHQLEDSLSTDPEHCYYNYSAFKDRQSDTGHTTDNAVPNKGNRQKQARTPDPKKMEDEWVDKAYRSNTKASTGNRTVEDSSNGDDMVDNTYYDGGQEESVGDDTTYHCSKDHTDMTENTYYGDEEEEENAGENFVDNNYYESQVTYPKVVGNNKPVIKSAKPSSSRPGKTAKTAISKKEDFDESGENYYDLEEYQPKAGQKAAAGNLNKPAVPKKPKPMAKPTDKEKIGETRARGNYAYTYQHFSLEGRDRQPKQKDSEM